MHDPLGGLIRQGQVPLCDRRISHITYYSNYDAAKKFHKADRHSQLHILGRPYAASYDEYSVAFVLVHHCAELKYMNE